MIDARNASTKTILLPLLVMLLLTLLVGLSAYELTNTWRQSAEQTARKAVEAVMLTNIRWGLLQTRQTLTNNPTAALKSWADVRQQVNLLAETNPQEPDFVMLESFMANSTNIRNIEPILGKRFLNIKLSENRQDLESLKQYSHFVTTAVLLCMIVLGGVLTGITAWDLSRLLQALIRSRDLNIRLQEEERRRIAQDLHDGVVQELIDLKRRYSPEKVDSLINNLRRVCHNLKPQVLEDLGLAAALEFLTDDLRQTGIAQVQVNLDCDGLALLPKAYELPLFRVVQELFSNIKNHAQASQVTLTLVYNPQESPLLTGYISDNGRGFDLSTVSVKSMGLAGVRERIQQLGGRLKIISAPGQGSRFQFSIPVKQEASRHVRSAALV